MYIRSDSERLRDSHQPGVVHEDLKTRKHQYYSNEVKIIDLEQLGFTESYQAPEILSIFYSESATCSLGERENLYKQGRLAFPAPQKEINEVMR